MNLLILAAEDNLVAFYATPTPDALRAQVGQHRDITQHYTIPCPQAGAVVKAIGRGHAGKLLGIAPPWYVMDMTEAIGVATRALAHCGATALVVRGAIRLKARPQQVAA